MSDSPDYASITIPADEDPSEYHYTARRAAILQVIKRTGTPASVNRRQAGERFGVSRQTIQNDIDALAEYVTENIGGERAAFTANTVFETSVRELLADEEYEAAARVAEKWMNWLGDIGALEQAADKQEIAMNASMESWEPPKMAPKNEEHFDNLIKSAEKACENTVVHHDGHGNVVGDD